VLYGAGLGRSALSNPDEGRYAEIPREMLAADDYVTPRLNGVVYFEKPPLTYWLVAGALQLFGPGETAARATPALFGLLGVVLLYAAVRRTDGRNAAWWAALVLATSLLYFAHARILLVDMVVSVLLSAVLFCFFLGVREPAGPRRRRLFLGLYAAAALATLAKGLIGFLLPGAVMFLWLLLFNQWRRLRPLHLFTGLPVFAAIAVPWHLLVAQRNPPWAWFYFVHEHWLRFTTTTHGRHEPWWFFLPIVILGLFPWAGFLGAGLRRATAGGWARRESQAEAWFPVLWAGFILLFFSASQSKLVPYVLPVFPPLAWLIGRAIAARGENDSPDFWRWPLAVAAGVTGLLGAAFAAVVAKPALLRLPDLIAQLPPLIRPAAVGLLAGGGLAGWWAWRGRPQRARMALGASTLLLYGTLVVAQPVASHPGTKALAEIVTREAGPDDVVLHYHEFFHDFTYYARREVGVVAAEGELEVFLDPLAGTSGRFLKEAELRPLWTGPRRVFLVLRKRELPGLQGQPWFHGRVLGEETNHVLLSNRS
jgi:4-amino-4-deoxy-L-arabinose transferase-like glycosyltransferase